MSAAPRLLLDTHIVLWWLADDFALSDDLKVIIDDETDVFVSSATVWEVAIKQAKGKIISPADLPERIRDCDLPKLPISASHAIIAGRLPAYHHDPFDRMLIAQAQHERLTLVTRDKSIQRYDVSVLEV